MFLLLSYLTRLYGFESYYVRKHISDCLERSSKQWLTLTLNSLKYLDVAAIVQSLSTGGRRSPHKKMLTIRNSRLQCTQNARHPMTPDLPVRISDLVRASAKADHIFSRLRILRAENQHRNGTVTSQMLSPRGTESAPSIAHKIAVFDTTIQTVCDQSRTAPPKSHRNDNSGRPKEAGSPT